MITDGRVLEVLRATRSRLEDPEQEFIYTDWTSCACGHIYAAAYGHKATQPVFVAAAMSPWYSDLIQHVARALGWDGGPCGGHARVPGANKEGAWAAAYVSDYTFDALPGLAGRKGALCAINDAIGVIEAKQEKDRLDVLAQLRDVVADVELDTAVTA